MSEHLRKWNTARLMKKNMYKLWFLQNFKLNPELRDKYLELRRYMDCYFSDATGMYGVREHHVEDLKQYLDAASTFQQYVAKNPEDTEGIAALAKQMLNPAEGTEIVDARALDLDVYNEFLELVDYVEPVQVLLNCMPRLTGGSKRETTELWDELEQELRLYIQSKGAEVLLTYKTGQ
jgi:hypothetical protein